MELNPSDATSNMPSNRNSMSHSTLINLVKVKAEPSDNSELHKLGMNAIGNPSLNMVSVKSELDFFDELNRDKVDDIQLRQQMKL